jgi:hypothetical protein
VIRISVVLWAVFGSAGACAQAVQMHQLEGGITIRVPETTSIRQERPAAQVVLYRLTDSAGQGFLTIYIGNQPAPLRAPRGATASRVSVGGLTSFGVRWTDSRGHKFGVVRAKVSNSQWPAFAQLFYGPLNEAQVDAAESVIASLQLKPAAAAPGSHH